jgi:hypothetical protein
MWIFHRPPGHARHDAPLDTGTIHAGGVSVRTEHHTGLDRAAGIRNSEARGRRTWSRAIHDHVGNVPQAVDGPPPAEFLSAEQLLARLRPWVVTRDSIEPDTRWYTHARVVAPGLCEVLALDLDDSVLTLTDDALAPLGGVVDLRTHALDNLRALPVDTHTALHGPEGLRFHVMTGDSFFTSSRVLTANELAHDLTGRGLGPDGALVAMPNRHQLALCPVDTVHGTDLLPTLRCMTAFTADHFEDAVGQISPDVYWWHGGTLTRLVRQDGGEPEFTHNVEFEVLLLRLAGNGAAGHF